MSEQLTLPIGKPKPTRKRGTPKIAPPHRVARRFGIEDGRAGQRRNAALWPFGTYGHADYELGYAEGELQMCPWCGKEHTAGPEFCP